MQLKNKSPVTTSTIKTSTLVYALKLEKKKTKQKPTIKVVPHTLMCLVAHLLQAPLSTVMCQKLTTNTANDILVVCVLCRLQLAEISNLLAIMFPKVVFDQFDLALISRY